jgi:hypothetical protein
METVASDTVPVSAEEFIAPRRAIAANDVDLEAGIPECRCQVVEQIEDSRVVLVNCAGPVVAQIMVEANQGILIVAFAITVDDVGALSRMGVEEPQTVNVVRND